ncbi:LPXTG cell wall anchor domain-containing protein [Alloscardovia theropitheci]|uniref:LPXTG cell wall anchor domain-containing protein n=1 Tax=Alloscardovia theropitheci TaxID=2496842 RepID=A0A4R0QUK8_9BIFI|nr:LPXTG cell wall anchor domain-containing protein [Alloscardovia theropitheci]
MIGSTPRAYGQDVLTPRVTFDGISRIYNSNWSLNSYAVKYTITMDQPRTFGMKQTHNSMNVQLVEESGNALTNNSDVDGYTFTQVGTNLQSEGYTSIFTPSTNAGNKITLTFKLPQNNYWALASAFKFDFMFLEKQADGTYKQLSSSQSGTTGNQNGQSIKTNYIAYTASDGPGYKIHDLTGATPDIRVMCIDPFTEMSTVFLNPTKPDKYSDAIAKNMYYQRISEDNPLIGTAQGPLSSLGSGANRKWQGQELVKHLKMAYYYLENNWDTDPLVQRMKQYTFGVGGQHYNDFEVKHYMATLLGWVFVTNIAYENSGPYSFVNAFTEPWKPSIWTDTEALRIRNALGGTRGFKQSELQQLMDRIDSQVLTQDQLDSVTITIYQGVGQTTNTTSDKATRPTQDLITYEYSPSFPLNVLKVDSTDMTRPLRGATFELRDSSNRIIDTQTSDDNGDLSFRKIKPGTYTLRETQAPEGYDINSTVWTVVVTTTGVTVRNGSQTVGLVSEKLIVGDTARVRVNFSLHKIDKDNKSSALQGAVFILSGQGLSLEKETDNQGNVSFENLTPGNYILQEKTAPAGYVLNPMVYTITISVTGVITVRDDQGNIVDINSSGQLDVTNEKIRGKFRIHKVSKDTQQSLDGAEFVLKKDGQNIDTQTTQDGGWATFEHLDPGEYTMYESQAPSGYMTNGVTYTITVKNDGNVSYRGSDGSSGTDSIDMVMTIENLPSVPAKMLLRKYTHDSSGNGSPIITGILKLTLTPANQEARPIKDGQIVYTLDLSQQENNKDLEIEFPDYLEGEYLLTETQAPAGFIKTQETYRIRITSTVNSQGRMTRKQVSILRDTWEVVYTWLSGVEIYGGHTLEIYNEKPEYPHTGGMGTHPFLFAGGVLMLTGVMFGLRRRIRAIFVIRK